LQMYTNIALPSSTNHMRRWAGNGKNRAVYLWRVCIREGAFKEGWLYVNLFLYAFE